MIHNNNNNIYKFTTVFAIIIKYHDFYFIISLITAARLGLIPGEQHRKP